MEHYEFLFVLHKAHSVRKYIKAAEDEGEEFHVSDHFAPLECGLQAQAQIRKINLSDAEPKLILRLRHRPKHPGGPGLAKKTADVFFNKKYEALPTPIKTPEWTEYVYFSDDILRPITVENSDK